MLKLVFRSWGILAALVISFDAQAFRLEEHATLTRLAATEFEICYPGLLDISSIDALVDSNLNEDRNLPRKWLQYSHFYNPTKPILDLRKFPSEVSASDFRLGQLQTTIEGISISSAQTAAGIMDFFKQSLPELGHAIHHIQDMASPPHVVPVMHDLRDRYESLIMKTSDLPDLRLQRALCPRKLRREKYPKLEKIFQELAERTLASVKHPLSYLRDGRPRAGTWELFWLPSLDPVFGRYGDLGNRFGVSAFSIDTHGYEISSETYLEFKRLRMRDAINATFSALEWYFFGLN